VRRVAGHGIGHALLQHGFTGARRSDDESALPQPDGCKQINHPHRNVVPRDAGFRLENDAFGRIVGNEVLKGRNLQVCLGILAHDGDDLEHIRRRLFVGFHVRNVFRRRKKNRQSLAREVILNLVRKCIRRFFRIRSAACGPDLLERIFRQRLPFGMQACAQNCSAFNSVALDQCLGNKRIERLHPIGVMLINDQAVAILRCFQNAFHLDWAVAVPCLTKNAFDNLLPNGCHIQFNLELCAREFNKVFQGNREQPVQFDRPTFTAGAFIRDRAHGIEVFEQVQIRQLPDLDDKSILRPEEAFGCFLFS